jgi:ribose transport system substrate-binding protein
MIRKLSIIGLAGVAIAAAGCGSSSSTATATPAKHYSVTFIAGTTGDNFYTTLNCGAKQEAAKLGMTYSYTGASTWGAPQQIPYVQSVTAAHPDAVLIAPTDVTALIAPMQSMEQAGIKIAEVDTDITNGVETGIAITSISSNNLLGGKEAADALAKLINDKGTVMVINVTAGISTTDARQQGFTQEMAAKYPNIKVLATQFDNDSATSAASILESTYAANPDLNGIFAANVLTAEGVSTGITHVGATGTIKDVSFDAEPTDIAALKSGSIDALIAQEPATEGIDGVEQVYDALTGKSVTASIATGLVTITAANEASMSKYFYVSSC